MIDNLLDPAVLFFALGIGAGLLKSDLRLPDVLHEVLSIYLLLAIGIKGGVELTRVDIGAVLSPVTATLLLGVLIPLVAYPILRLLGRISVPDSAALAAHYGTSSAVTFAVVISFLDRLGVSHEGYVTVLLVLMEIPAIATGILIARFKMAKGPIRWGSLLHEIFLGKSIYLLGGGLVVGFLAGAERIAPVRILIYDLFTPALAFFLLEMGLLATRRLKDLKRAGLFLTGFAVGMPFLSCMMGLAAGFLTGLSVGGSTVLATLCASASYIAAPAAVRIAIPEANPTLYLTAALGITFPFNIAIGIPVYYQLAEALFRAGGLL